MGYKTIARRIAALEAAARAATNKELPPAVLIFIDRICADAGPLWMPKEPTPGETALDKIHRVYDGKVNRYGQ